MGAIGLSGLPRAGAAVNESVVLGVAYFVLALFAIHLAKQPDALTNVWFANAAAMAMLATTRRSHWPALLLSMVVANVAANVVYRSSIGLSLSFVPGNVVEVLAGAWLLQRNDLWRSFDRDATTFVRMLGAGAVLPELLGATLGALTLQWHGFATFQGAWLDWYVGSVLGATAVLPAALALRQVTAAQAWRQLTAPAALALLVFAVAFSLLVLRNLPHPMVYLSLPLIAGAFLVTPLAALVLCFAVVATANAAIAYAVLQPAVPANDWQRVLVFLPVVAVLVPAQLLALLMERRRVLVRTLAALNSASSDLAAFCDRQGVMQRVNRVYEEYMQCSSRDVVGRRFDETIPGHMLQAVTESFRRALAGERVRARVEADFPGPGKRTMDVTIEPARDAVGDIVGVVCGAHDVTSLVAAREDLKRALAELTERSAALSEAKQRAESADRLKSAFLATMSHELRTPLNSIIGFTGILLQGLPGPLTAEQTKQLTMVRVSARHLLSLINDVLDLSKIEAGQLEIAAEPVDVRASIEKVVSLVRPMAENKGLALTVAVAPDVGVAVSDPRRLEQILLNLLTNAVKFSERGEIALGAEMVLVPGGGADGSPQQGVRMRVSDTGIGIKPEDLATLFQPFRQVDNSLTRAQEGTGLGLAICRRLAELMRGELSAESEWGRGSAFTLTIPVTAGRPA
jgi:PAS domain S-box-containing protein